MAESTGGPLSVRPFCFGRANSRRHRREGGIEGLDNDIEIVTIQFT